jgi:predicted nucleotidyltransferase
MNWEAMGEATKEYFLAVLAEAVRLMDDNDFPHLVIGSLATGTLLDKEWVPGDDIDFFVRGQDTEAELETFEKIGYSVYRKDERWLYKVARPNVTIDLIFRASESIELEDEMLERSSLVRYDGVSIRIPAPEDSVVMKAITDSDERREHWYDCVQILERHPIDWDYLCRRALASSPGRILALLLYAQTGDAEIPGEAIHRLAEESLPAPETIELASS